MPGNSCAPEFVVLRRIGVDRFVWSAMNGEVGLAVAVKVQRAELDWPGDRLFENAGIDGLPVDRGQARARDIERDEFHSKFHKELMRHQFQCSLDVPRLQRTHICSAQSASFWDCSTCENPSAGLPNPLPSIKSKVCCPHFSTSCADSAREMGHPMPQAGSFRILS